MFKIKNWDKFQHYKHKNKMTWYKMYGGDILNDVTYMELSETENALTEITNSNEDVFKLVGNIMIKSKKEDIEKELKKKQELLSLRLKSIESQESDFTKKSEELREEVMKKIK